MRSWQHWLIATVSLAATAGLAAAEPDVGDPPIAAPAPPVEDAAQTAKVDELLGKLRGATGEARLTAARELASVGEAAYASLLARLTGPRRNDVGALRSALVAIDADLPGKDGTFKLKRADKRGDDDAPPVEADWLAALAALPVSDGATEAFEMTALIRAIAATHRHEAVRALLDWSFTDLGNLFRDEVGRQIRSMGSTALPGLARAARDRSSTKVALLARYANYQLDRMDRQRPSRALGSVDEQEQVELLRAYGDTRHPDAVVAVLGLVASPSSRVRRMARWATLRYVTGPAPKEAPKRQMKLPGGQLSDKAVPLYFTYREIADVELRKALEARDGKAPDADLTPAQLARQLFTSIDEELAEGWRKQLADAQQKRSAGDLAGAIAGYDALLAQEPTFEARGEMAAGYFEYGQALSAKQDWHGAAQAFDKAYSVAPEGPTAKKAEAELAYARGMAARAAGKPGAGADELARAFALDPGHPGARGVAKAEAQKEAAKDLRWLLALGLGAGIAGLGLLVAYLLRRRAAHA